MKEEWKDIEGYEGYYQISSLGRVKSLGRWQKVGIKNTSICFRAERIMKLSTDSCGYKQVCLTKNSKKITKSIHKIMAKHFILNPENKPEVNHKDGIKINNNINNLEWVTHRENLDHAIKYGLRAIGGRHGATKLKENDVLEIRKLFKDKIFSMKELAKIFGIGESTTQQIICRRYWKHI